LYRQQLHLPQLRQDYTDIANTLIANKNLRELVAQATL
jgi:hypothetical protein